MRLYFDESDAVISLTIEHDGQAVRNETVLDRKKVRGPDMAKGFIIEWSKLHLWPVFAAMPVESFQVVYPEGAGEILVSAAMTVGEVLANTNVVLAKIADLAGAAKGKPRTLYVNTSDDLRYASLYEKIRDENWLYLNHQLGYDRKTRTWGKTEPPLGVDELVQHIVRNDIGRLVAVNTYLVENYFSVDRVWLPAILERLGVEHVTIDNDPHDLRPWGFLMRKLVSSGAPRFSNLSILNE